MGFIWIERVGDRDFKVIFAIENSNKFPRPRFCKE